MKAIQPLFIRAIDCLLNRIDRAFKIDYADQLEPEFKVGDGVQDYSKEILRELHGDMRAQRETELKMVPLFFQVCTFVLAANLLAFFNSSRTAALVAFLLLAVFSLLFVVLFWLQLHIRIAHDHGTYKYLGARVTAIRKFWKIHEFFLQATDRQPLGAGPGYKMNQRLVATAALFLIAAIVAAVMVRLGAWYLQMAS